MPKCKECVCYKDCAPCVSPEDEAGCGAYRSVKDEINNEVSKVISDIRKKDTRPCGTRIRPCERVRSYQGDRCDLE
jgi:hypothetical protein